MYHKIIQDHLACISQPQQVALRHNYIIHNIIVNSQYSSESSYVSYTALLFPFNWGYSFFWVGFWGGIPTGVPTPLSPSCFCERSPFPPYSPLCWHWTTGCSSPHSSNVRTYNYHCIGISPYCYRDSRALTASSRYTSSCCPSGSLNSIWAHIFVIMYAIISPTIFGCLLLMSAT